MPDRATIRAWQAIAAAERETGITGKSSADATYAAQTLAVAEPLVREACMLHRLPSTSSAAHSASPAFAWSWPWLLLARHLRLELDSSFTYWAVQASSFRNLAAGGS